MVNNKSKNIIKIISISIILIFTLFVYWYIKVGAFNNGEYVQVSSAGDNYNISVQSDMVLEHSFTYEKDAMRAVMLTFDYYDAPSQGEVVVRLINAADNQIMRETRVATVGLIDEDYTIFDMGSIITGLKGKELKVQVAFENVLEGEIKLLGGYHEDGSSLFDIVVVSAGKDVFMTIIKIVFGLLIVAILSVSAITLFKEKFKLENVYLICAISLGFAMNLCIPLWVAPDEIVHNYKAYEVSNDILGIDNTANNTLMMRYDDAVARYKSKEVMRSDYNELFGHLFDELQNAELIDSGITTHYAQKYLFFIPALGITIGRLLGLGTTLTFVLGRIFNLLMFTMIVYYSIKKIPFAKSVVFVWALIPVTLQQAGSYSYDCPINALSILVISLTMSFMYGEEKSKRSKYINIAILVLAVLLLAPCKSFALLPVAALPMMIVVKYLYDNKEKIKSYLSEHRKIKIGLVSFVFLTCIGVAVIAIRVIQVLLAGADGNGVYLDHVGLYAYPAGYYLKNPIDFIGRFITTVWTKGDYHFYQLFGSELGWLDIRVPIVFIIPIFLVLLYAGFRREDEEQLISVTSKAWMWIVFIGTCFLAALGMLLHWTAKSDSFIQGIQGRYYLPALVLPVLAIRTKTACVSKNADRIIATLIPIIYIFIFTSILKYSF